MKHAIQQIAENHGFQYEIAFTVWQEVGSFEETDEVLKEMREAAQIQAEKRLQRRRLAEGEHHDDDEDEDDDDTPLPVPMEHDANAHSASSEYNLLEAQNHANPRTPAFKYVPAIIDTEDPEYEPPSDSRAALFARLAGEGRIEEAKRRDHKRRKSGIMPEMTPYKV